MWMMTDFNNHCAAWLVMLLKDVDGQISMPDGGT